jgi:hypothetical protein
MAAIPATRLYLARPGEPAPIQVLVNGVPLLHGCPAASLTLPASPSVGSSEGRTLFTEAGQCAFAYSSHLTPAIGAVGPTSVSQAQQTLSITGLFRFSGSPGDIEITVAGAACPVTAVTATAAAPPPDAGQPAAAGSPPPAALGAEPAYAVSCALPMLPAGQNELRVLVAGSGAAELPGAAARLALSYAPALASIGPLRGAPSGGTDVVLTGAHFAPMPAPAAGALANRTTTVTLSGGPPGSPLRLDVLSVNLTTITARLRRAVASSASSGGSGTSALSFRVSVADAVAGGSSSSGALSFTLDRGYAPSVAGLSPTALAAGAAAPLIGFEWTAAAAAAGAVALAGNGSRAAVQLISYGSGGGGAVAQASYDCGGAVALNSSSGGGSYSEHVTCSPPAALPAGEYVLWACLPSGCGHAATNLTVSASVSGVSPNTSTTAGGQLVTISGLGFSSNAGQVSARFGASPCRVLASNFTAVTCLTSAAASASAASTAALVLVPGLGAQELALPGLALLYDPAVTPAITSIDPSKGSTEGGTLLRITGEQASQIALPPLTCRHPAPLPSARAACCLWPPHQAATPCASPSRAPQAPASTA